MNQKTLWGLPIVESSDVPETVFEAGSFDDEWMRKFIDSKITEGLRAKGLRTIGDWVTILESAEVSDKVALDADLAKLRAAPQDRFPSDEDEWFLKVMYGDPDAPRLDLSSLYAAFVGAPSAVIMHPHDWARMNRPWHPPRRVRKHGQPRGHHAKKQHLK